MAARTIKQQEVDKIETTAEVTVNLTMLLILVVLSAIAVLGSLWFVNALLHSQIILLNPVIVGAL